MIELVDSNTKHRKVSLIDEIFEPKEDEAIRMPLSNCNRSNRRVWKGSIDGKFIVRSAYHSHSKLMEQLKGQPSSSASFS